MQSATEKAIEQLKQIGYTNEKIKEVLILLLPDVGDQLLLDLAGRSTDEDLEEFEKRMKDAKDPEVFDEILKDMAHKAYGDDASEKLDAILADLLKEMKEFTLKIRETYKKYMAGDPKTKKQMDEFVNSPEYKEMEEEMKKAGFDFQAEAVK
jgi:DNA-binding transcriptional MerR regulator